MGDHHGRGRHYLQFSYMPLGEEGRLANLSTIPPEIIEVQLGERLGKDRIGRFEDSYGRGVTSAPKP